MKSILIMGGQGFIGHNLTHFLAQEGHDITVYTRNINKMRIVPGVRYIEGNFGNENRYDSLLYNIDCVYHLISRSVPHKDHNRIASDIQTEVIGSISLFNACLERNIKVVYSSSGGTVYGENKKCEPSKENDPTFPHCSYGINKLSIENYLRLYHELYGLNSVILRLANPYGPHNATGRGAIDVFCSKIIAQKQIEVRGNGLVTRDYIHISDVCRALSIASDYSSGCHIFNIGTGKGHSLNEIISIIGKMTGETPTISYYPPNNEDVSYNVLNIEKANKHLGWWPNVTLEKGIERKIKELRLH